MKNMAFEEMSTPEKREKLRAVLREKTGGLLRDEELAVIIRHTPLREQYGILVYRDFAEMINNIFKSQNYAARFLVGGTQMPGADLDERFVVAANEDSVITVFAKCTNSIRRIIFIYIPQYRKRANYHGCKREKENACV